MDSGREYWTSCFVSAACELSILERGKLFLATRYNIGVQGWSKDVESILYFVPTVIEAGEIMEKMVKDRFFKP